MAGVGGCWGVLVCKYLVLRTWEGSDEVTGFRGVARTLIRAKEACWDGELLGPDTTWT